MQMNNCHKQILGGGGSGVNGAQLSGERSVLLHFFFCLFCIRRLLPGHIKVSHKHQDFPEDCGFKTLEQLPTLFHARPDLWPQNTVIDPATTVLKQSCTFQTMVNDAVPFCKAV